MTVAEKHIWEYLRNRSLEGLKFRRQQIIEGFIVDFFCNDLQLVVEVDGSVHGTDEQKMIDKHRREIFHARGIGELRFINSEVLNDLDTVLKKITEFKDRCSN